MPYSLTPSYDEYPSMVETVARLRDYLHGELAQYESDLELNPQSLLDRPMLERVWKRSKELGFYGANFSPEYGGMGLSNTELAILKEEISASGRVLGHAVLGELGGPLRIGSMVEHATEYQVQNYVIPVIAADRACCFAMTEDDAGSDVRAMQTTAYVDGDGWRISGKKVFATAGPFADFAIVVARMEGEGKPSFSTFFVDFDSPGVTVEAGDVPIWGQNLEANITFDSVRVERNQLVGEVGQGLKIALGRVTANRLLHCPTILGYARRAIEISTEYAKERVVFGGRLADLQVIRHKIADMTSTYYAARSMSFDGFKTLDSGRDASVEAFMCKLFVAEKCFDIADEAMQICGKSGMVRGAEMEQLFQKLRMYRVVTGTSEIQKNAIAKIVLD
ncbi:acyl-CoA dehydrogenase family protein [Dietzia maris]